MNNILNVVNNFGIPNMISGLNLLSNKFSKRVHGCYLSYIFDDSEKVNTETKRQILSWFCKILDFQ